MDNIQRILLTVYTEEGFHSRVEGTGFDKKRPKGNYETKDGIFRGRIPSQRDYVSHSKSRVRTTILPEKTVEFFQSSESKPSKYCKERNEWMKMKAHQRLFYNLQQLAEGKRFEFSFFE
jgi:hypothetical protein